MATMSGTKVRVSIWDRYGQPVFQGIRIACASAADSDAEAQFELPDCPDGATGIYSLYYSYDPPLESHAMQIEPDGRGYWRRVPLHIKPAFKDSVDV